MNILNDLSSRQLVRQITDEQELSSHVSQQIGVFAGFDPTGPSLHAGHLLPLFTLKRFAQAGHRAFALIGTATAGIGDPRDVGERVMQDPHIIQENTKKITQQIQRIAPELTIVNNDSWTNNVTALTLLRDIGKHFTINSMLSRETVKNRLQSDGMSFTEFSYLLLQAHDFATLHDTHNVTVQIGGSDQWSNIIGGVDLIKKTVGEKSFGLTLPLITTSDGKKFGKSTNGVIWLDDTLTSPFEFHQWLLNTSDADVIKLLHWLTFLDMTRIKELETHMLAHSSSRDAQKVLADHITSEVFGKDKLHNINTVNDVLFRKAPVTSLDIDTIMMIGEEVGLTVTTVDKVMDALVSADIDSSKNALQRTMKQGGVKINDVTVFDSDSLHEAVLLHDRFMIVRKGKKKFHVIDVMGS